MDYDPKPPEHDGIEVPADLLELLEQLAEDAHDPWASSVWLRAGAWGRSGMTGKRSIPAWCLSEDFKNYNYETIRSLPVFVAMVGFQI